MMKNMKILAALLFAAAALTVTGCPQAGGSGGSGTDNNAEKHAFQANIAEPKGMLKVTVQGQAVSAVFESDGKTYSGTGAVGTDGAVSVELSSQADAQNKYGFTGTYDSAKKMFGKAQFGKTGALKDIDFAAGANSGKPQNFYVGTVLGLGLHQYNVTVTVKNEAQAAVLFSRELNRRTDGFAEQVYTAVEGAVSGNKVTAKVRLEGENFTFEAVLNGDGYLRETRLLGERSYNGERNPTLIYEYEAKGLDEHTAKSAAEHFKGDLTLTMQVSMDRYLAMKDKKQKKAGTYEVGEILVTFRDLTDKANTRLYKGRVRLTKDGYEKGVAVNLYNLLHRPGIIQENTADKNTGRPGSLGTDTQPVMFVFVARSKDWYNKDKHSFKGVTFGRAKTLDKILGKGIALSDKLTLVK